MFFLKRALIASLILLVSLLRIAPGYASDLSIYALNRCSRALDVYVARSHGGRWIAEGPWTLGASDGKRNFGEDQGGFEAGGHLSPGSPRHGSFLTHDNSNEIFVYAVLEGQSRETFSGNNATRGRFSTKEATFEDFSGNERTFSFIGLALDNEECPIGDTKLGLKAGPNALGGLGIIFYCDLGPLNRMFSQCQ